MADCHIGGWNEPKMKQLGLLAFETAMARCIEEKLDFILIAGDLFNTALPQIDLIRDAAAALKKAKDAGIPVYIVPGSHDFSPSGKTMLEVLEKAGLCENVMRIKDGKLELLEKDGFKISGMFGRKGALEKEDYGEIQMKHLEEAEGFKIFMLHTALDELKPQGMEDMEAMKMAELPKNFSYYAAGHVHAVMEKGYGNGIVVFPGALFPNNFKELEEFKHGGFYIVETNGKEIKKEYVPVKLKEVEAIEVDADGKSPMQVSAEAMGRISAIDSADKIVLMRIAGTLASGKPSDINFREILEKSGNAYFVAKNTSRLLAKEFEQQEILQTENIEPELIAMHSGKSGLFEAGGEKELMACLIAALDKEKEEGEKTADFEKRITAEGIAALGLKGYLS